MMQDLHHKIADIMKIPKPIWTQLSMNWTVIILQIALLNAFPQINVFIF